MYRACWCFPMQRVLVYLQAVTCHSALAQAGSSLELRLPAEPPRVQHASVLWCPMDSNPLSSQIPPREGRHIPFGFLSITLHQMS